MRQHLSFKDPLAKHVKSTFVQLDVYEGLACKEGHVILQLFRFIVQMPEIYFFFLPFRGFNGLS